jgi:tetratricopeptide (TPR) repeat protein
MARGRNIITFLFFLLAYSFIRIDNASAVSFSKEQIFQIATLAAHDGEYDKAADFFKKVLEIDPHFAPAYNSLGMVFQSMPGDDNNAEACRYFRLAVDMDPGYVEAWNNLGRMYYSSGQFVQAEKALLRSLEISPHQSDIALVLGWVYLIGESRAEQAIKYFEQRLDSADDDMARYGIGLANILLGEKFKVLDVITVLRKHHKEDLGAKLESMVRDNVKIASRPGMPLITGITGGDSVYEKELQDLAARGFDAGANGKAIKVRLKGPLVD